MLSATQNDSNNPTIIDKIPDPTPYPQSSKPFITINIDTTQQQVPIIVRLPNK